jgi:hypothetical protein
MLHLVALAVSVVCLLFSVRQAWRSQWTQAFTDAAMVALMAFVAFFTSPLTSLVAGALLIALAIVEAAIARRSTVAGHMHRAVCLLIMGATTIAMLGHGVAAVPVHSHALALATVGVIGLVAVVGFALAMRRKMTVPSAGMLVATALMSVATIAG